MKEVLSPVHSVSERDQPSNRMPSTPSPSHTCCSLCARDPCVSPEGFGCMDRFLRPLFGFHERVVLTVDEVGWGGRDLWL